MSQAGEAGKPSRQRQDRERDDWHAGARRWGHVLAAVDCQHQWAAMVAAVSVVAFVVVALVRVSVCVCECARAHV